MKNDYSWVAEKKQEAMRQKLARRGMPSYSQRPVSERFGVSYTGLGDDGQLDKSAPAGFDTFPSPHVYHEGETQITTPEGRMYLTADVTNRAGLAPAAQGASQLQPGQMQGFATGGGATVGVSGAQAAPQYAPRVGNNPYMANIIPNRQAQQQQQQQQQNNAPQPLFQAGGINPQAMGNSGAALLAQGGRAGQQQPQMPQQQYAPAPRVGDNPYMASVIPPEVPPQPTQEELRTLDGQMPGFADGGIVTSETTGGGTGSGNSGISPPTKPTRPTFHGGDVGGGADTLKNNNGGKNNTFWTGVNNAVKGVTDGVFGGAADTLNNNNNKSSNNPWWTGVNNVVKGVTDGVVGGAVGAIQGTTAGGQSAATGGNNGLMTRSAKGGIENPDAGGLPEAPPDYLSGERPARTEYSNEPTNIQFPRGAEGQWRVDDMRREAAAQQAYLQHQQAMRGTDANAAWAQSAMAKAGAEEGINNFAAEYAAGADERNWNRINNMVSTILSDPNSSEADLKYAAQMANQLYPGADIDFSGRINAANAQQFNDGMGELLAAVASGMNWEEAWSMLKASGVAEKMGLSEREVWEIYNGASINAIDKQWEIIATSDVYKSLPQDRQEAFKDFWSGMQLGDVVWDSEQNKYRLRSEVEAEKAKFELEAKEKEEQIKSDVTGIKNGTLRFSEYNFGGDKDNPVYQELLKSTPEGIGNQERVGATNGTQIKTVYMFDVGRAASAGDTMYPKLEQAHESGSAVKIGNQLYYVDSIQRTGGYHHESTAQAALNFAKGLLPIGGQDLGRFYSGSATYTLVDPITGESKTISSEQMEL